MALPTKQVKEISGKRGDHTIPVHLFVHNRRPGNKHTLKEEREKKKGNIIRVANEHLSLCENIANSCDQNKILYEGSLGAHI